MTGSQPLRSWSRPDHADKMACAISVSKASNHVACAVWPVSCGLAQQLRCVVQVNLCRSGLARYVSTSHVRL